MTYKFLSTVFCALSISLGMGLVFRADLITLLFGIDDHPSADLLARRAGMLFWGWALVTFLSRDAAPSDTRQHVTLGMAAVMGGLAIVGTYELVTGSAGPGIGVAIGGEVALTIAALVVHAKNRASVNQARAN